MRTVTGCTDGEYLAVGLAGLRGAGVIMDKSGNLYGTTSAGGAHYSQGTVFELTPNATKTKWTETVLHSFCAGGVCTDGPSGRADHAALMRGYRVRADPLTASRALRRGIDASLGLEGDYAARPGRSSLEGLRSPLSSKERRAWLKVIRCQSTTSLTNPDGSDIERLIMAFVECPGVAFPRYFPV
jgi:uncharacterized repeat protein (TIGR03803 family)